jgi:hypothetical protein
MIMSKQSKRERQQWTEYVRQMEERKGKKSRKPRARTKREVPQAELEAGLDDLVAESVLEISGRTDAKP